MFVEESDVNTYGGIQQTMGLPTKKSKNEHFGVFWGYHHLRKQPIYVKASRSAKRQTYSDLFWQAANTSPRVVLVVLFMQPIRQKLTPSGIRCQVISVRSERASPYNRTVSPVLGAEKCLGDTNWSIYSSDYSVVIIWTPLSYIPCAKKHVLANCSIPFFSKSA